VLQAGRADERHRARDRRNPSAEIAGIRGVRPWTDAELALDSPR